VLGRLCAVHGDAAHAPLLAGAGLASLVRKDGNCLGRRAKATACAPLVVGNGQARGEGAAGGGGIGGDAACSFCDVQVLETVEDEAQATTTTRSSGAGKGEGRGPDSGRGSMEASATIPARACVSSGGGPALSQDASRPGLGTGQTGAARMDGAPARGRSLAAVASDGGLPGEGGDDGVVCGEGHAGRKTMADMGRGAPGGPREGGSWRHRVAEAAVGAFFGCLARMDAVEGVPGPEKAGK
jgi:hypothetical protein